MSAKIVVRRHFQLGKSFISSLALPIMKTVLRSSLLFVSMSLVSACTSHAPKQANWPQGMPSRDYFVAQFESDPVNKQDEELDEYLLWVVRFYEGWELYHNGWIKVTKDSVATVKDAQKAEEITHKMNLIGQGIASEWAKGKKDRRILTRHIVVWGNALVESIKRDQEIPLIDRVLADVNGLVAKEVAIDEIRADRYFPRDGDDVFM